MASRLGSGRGSAPSPSFRRHFRSGPTIDVVPRVLLLARFFPPIGGAGVHRSVGSVRHLPAYGYEPLVVTGAGEQRGRWDAQDPELLERLPVEAEVHRLEGSEP